MGKFKKIETGIEGLYIIEPTVFGDERGFFIESYNKNDFIELGIADEFVQDNHSKSKKRCFKRFTFSNKIFSRKVSKSYKGSCL